MFVPCRWEAVSENLLDYTTDGDMERQDDMAGWKAQAEVAAIRKRYPAGSRIELDYMNEQGMPPGQNRKSMVSICWLRLQRIEINRLIN